MVDVVFLYATFEGDLPRVQEMQADGDPRITAANLHGQTPSTVR
jgi:hypothetical protein